MYPCLPSSPLFLTSWAVKDTVYQERVKMKMISTQHNFKPPTPVLVLLSVMSQSAEASSKPCSSYGVRATYVPSAVSLCHSLLASSCSPRKEPLVFRVSVPPLYGSYPPGTKTMFFKAWVGWECAQLVEFLPSMHEDLSLLLNHTCCVCWCMSVIPAPRR